MMDDNEVAVKHFENAASVARREGDENAATYKVRSDRPPTRFFTFPDMNMAHSDPIHAICFIRVTSETSLIW